MTRHESVELAFEAVLQELQRLVAHHLDLADDALVQLVLPFESLHGVQVLILARLAKLGTRADHGLKQSIIFLILWLIYSAEVTIFRC